jgi:hypothetical protein
MVDLPPLTPRQQQIYAEYSRSSADEHPPEDELGYAHWLGWEHQHEEYCADHDDSDEIVSLPFFPGSDAYVAYMAGRTAAERAIEMTDEWAERVLALR